MEEKFDNSIYFDNSATTKVYPEVKDIMIKVMDVDYGNPSSLHLKGVTAEHYIKDSAKIISDTLKVSPDEIIFTSGGTESNNLAVASGIGNGCALTSTIEHHSVLNASDRYLMRVALHANASGIVDDIDTAGNIEPCFISVMLANNEVGTIQPVAEIGEMCECNNVRFHTDAVQAVGHIPVDVETLHVDYLSASGHKFHGPKGVGFLYVAKGACVTPQMLGGGQESGARSGTENVPGIVGMAAALKESVDRMQKDTEHISKLRDKLIDGLLDIPGSWLNGDPVQRLPGNVNVGFEGVEGNSLVFALSWHGICISAGSACTTGTLEPSHVLTAMGQPPEQANCAVRMTLSRYNTAKEIDTIIHATRREVARLRELGG